MTRHLHLDLLGGLSGDMFIGGMLDVFPELAAGFEGALDAAGFPGLVALENQPHDDGVLTGTRFNVVPHQQENHAHRRYAEICDTLAASRLEPATRDAALSIFHLLARVEADIHGKEVEDVVFHEVGAWDSIADIVLAAHVINATDVESWSLSAVPLGGGFIDTAHGRLPVPAPATARLLEGFAVVDDGIEGERITPTGAAIMRYLSPSRRLPPGLSLAASGYGFGAKKLPGVSNVVRICVYEQEAKVAPWREEEIVRLSFELDDQTPEGIAHAMERLRCEEGVLDVTQHTYTGKKNRQGFSMTVLARPAYADDITTLCFLLTTTLGVRRESLRRAVLEREEVVVYVDKRACRVKVAKRPGGYTAKMEMDDLAAAGLTLDEQNRLRLTAESLAIKQAEAR